MYYGSTPLSPYHAGVTNDTFALAPELWCSVADWVGVGPRFAFAVWRAAWGKLVSLSVLDYFKANMLFQETAVFRSVKAALSLIILVLMWGGQ